jgi:hypothetical protein
VIQFVDGAAYDLRKEDPDAVVEEDANSAPDEATTIPFEIGNERA